MQMDRKYSDKKLDQIAERIVKQLSKQEDGFNSTVAMMASGLGYSDMEMEDLFVLNEKVFKLANESGLTLDMSAHDGLFEGLPFNLDFTLKRD